MPEAVSLTPDQRALFYRYDRTLPLNAEELPLAQERETRVRRFTFDSIHDQRVPGVAWLPAEPAQRRPLIILQHGAGSHKEADYIRLPAMRWTRLGFICVSIDAHAHGQREPIVSDPSRLWQLPWTRKEHSVQMAVDLMRTVDYLETWPEVDVARLGFLGFSMGTIMGVPFVGLDGRVKSACLAIGGSMEGRSRQLVDAAQRWEQEAAAAICDPVHFAPLVAPRRVLMINGRRDDVVPPAAAERLFAALQEPKRISWYDGGHTDLRGEQFREMLEFFQETL